MVTLSFETCMARSDDRRNGDDRNGRRSRDRSRDRRRSPDYDRHSWQGSLGSGDVKIVKAL